MAKTSRVSVAIGDFVIWVVLGAVVVRKLDDAFSICPMVSVRDCLGAIVCEEVEVELGVRVLKLVDQLQTEKLVELD